MNKNLMIYMMAFVTGVGYTMGCICNDRYGVAIIAILIGLNAFAYKVYKETVTEERKEFKAGFKFITIPEEEEDLD